MEFKMAKVQCKGCGSSFSSISSMTVSNCNRHPNKGRHELYEGSEKSKYTCKNCGSGFSSISSMTASNCSRHPNKGRHEPVL